MQMQGSTARRPVWRQWIGHARARAEGIGSDIHRVGIALACLCALLAVLALLLWLAQPVDSAQLAALAAALFALGPVCYLATCAIGWSMNAMFAGAVRRVLVCGGRSYSDRQVVVEALGRLHAEHGFDLVIIGGARGAHKLAEEWARSQALACDVHEPDWARFGRAAGPIRNQQMLADCKPDLVVVFPGESGTADMVRRARKAGVRVIEIAGCDTKL